MINYTSRYGLEFNPFIKNSKEILIETEDYKEIVFRLNYLLSVKGFGLVTGNPGLGKTTALRTWVSTLNQSAYKVVYIPMSTLTVMEFYRQLALELGVEPQFRKVDNFRAIQAAIMRYEKEKKMTVVIILDEANHLNSKTLSDLKLLFNFDMDSKDRAVIILSGLPLINNTLRMTAFEPVRQRIIMNYEIDPLSREEARTYISAKLKGAGCYQEVFDSQALEAIVNAANGIPRMINQICNSSMIVGNNKGQNIIDSTTVMECVNGMIL